MGQLKCLALSIKRIFLILTLMSSAAAAQSPEMINLLGSETQQQDLRIFETVPEIKLSNLGSYRGQYLKMYYVVGLAPLLDSPENILVREIKRIDMVKIEHSDYVVPSVRIPKQGISTSYNYLIMTISKSSRSLLTNPDGSVAPGQESQSQGVIDATARRFVVSRQQILKPSIDAGVWEWGMPEPDRFIPFEFRLP